MSKHKAKRKKSNVRYCPGCKRLVHPRRMMLVDPKRINLDLKPLWLCGECRLRLAWKKVEVPNV